MRTNFELLTRDEFEAGLSIFQRIADTKSAIYICGSRVTCNPPPVGTDIDVLVSVANEEALRTINLALEQCGYYYDSGDGYEAGQSNVFFSFKHKTAQWPNFNFLLSTNFNWCARHNRATALCRHLNLLNKPDRIAVFRTILYDVEHK